MKINSQKIIEKLGLIIFFIGFGIRLTNGIGYSAECFMVTGIILYVGLNNCSHNDTNKSSLKDSPKDLNSPIA